jgi:tRNA (mo5U34)-methyltransferase
MSSNAPSRGPEALRAAVAANPVWYHTMELAPGVTTPGWFDLRGMVDELPWPDVRGKRCLDVGTYDGFLAFEMERRGAAEVVAIDLASHEDWDFSVRDAALGTAVLAQIAGEKGRGFEIAAEALGSSVERRFISVYGLADSGLGMFDVVVCGSLLLHLRDPFRALDAIRRVCRERFMSLEQIDARLTLLHRRRPAMRLNGRSCQWLTPNSAAHVRMIDVAGFDVLRAVRPPVERFGSAHPPNRWNALTRLENRLLGGPGVPTHAVLARPMQAPDGRPSCDLRIRRLRLRSRR